MRPWQEAPNTPCVLLFAKAPVQGRVKTRLVPALGELKACALHDRLARHAIATLHELDDIKLRLYCDDPEHALVMEWLGPGSGVSLHAQSSGDLGQRMRRAVEQSVAATDAGSMLLIGSDCPFIDRDYIAAALDKLHNDASVVFGPAADGGYVLLGLKRSVANSEHALDTLFKDIGWGGDQVLAQSLEAAARAGLSVAKLSTLADIDRPSDLQLLDQVDWKN